MINTIGCILGIVFCTISSCCFFHVATKKNATRGQIVLSVIAIIINVVCIIYDIINLLTNFGMH